jgi:hypothetical protein
MTQIRQVSLGTTFGSMVAAIVALTQGGGLGWAPALLVFGLPIAFAIYVIGTPPAAWILCHVFKLLKNWGLSWHPAAVGAATATTALVTAVLAICFSSNDKQLFTPAMIGAMTLVPSVISWGFAKVIFAQHEGPGPV